MNKRRSHVTRHKSQVKKSVVLLSGGLDSATVLYYAKDKGYRTHCLIFDYGQRHRKEIRLAQELAEKSGDAFEIVKISLPWQGSALLDKKSILPCTDEDSKEIPTTYVPARNIIFLSFAASFAEAVDAPAVFIGANAVDYSGYPDCRPEFYEAYQKALKQGLKTGVEGKNIKIYTPLIHKTKAGIIKLGTKLGVPYELTWSCYKGGNRPCGECDSCRFRARGFREAGIEDPALK